MVSVCPHTWHFSFTHSLFPSSFLLPFLPSSSKNLAVATRTYIQSGLTPPNLPANSLPCRSPFLPSDLSTLATLASLLFPLHTGHAPASGPLLLLLVFPGIVFSPVTPFIYMLTCPPTREVVLDHSATTRHSQSSFTLPYFSSKHWHLSICLLPVSLN